MAKKETKAPATADGAATPKAAPTPKATGGTDKFVRVMKDGKPTDPGKMPPQALVIVNTIEAAGKTGLTRDDLVKNLTGVLKTRQPVGRIVSYYQKLITTSGAVTMAVAAPVAAAA